jgi:hypothetical protein
MSETPQESEQTDTEAPPPDGGDERTADPDLGVQDASEVPAEPDDPVDPDPDPIS